jgi:hypothetical protein
VQAKIDHQAQRRTLGRAMKRMQHSWRHHDECAGLHLGRTVGEHLPSLPAQVENRLAPSMPMRLDRGMLLQMAVQGKRQDAQAGDLHLGSTNEKRSEMVHL